MIVSYVELPDQLGGNIQILFIKKEQRRLFIKFLRMLPNTIVVDGEVL